MSSSTAGATNTTTTKNAAKAPARLESNSSGTSPCSSVASRNGERAAPTIQMATSAIAAYPSARHHDAGRRSAKT